MVQARVVQARVVQARVVQAWVVQAWAARYHDDPCAEHKTGPIPVAGRPGHDGQLAKPEPTTKAGRSGAQPSVPPMSLTLGILRMSFRASFHAR